jgi:hypothetical protein
MYAPPSLMSYNNNPLSDWMRGYIGSLFRDTPK